jgi:diguanylate cyclase (GGDEF)-like protein
MIAAMGAMRREPQLIQQQLAEMERTGTEGSTKSLPFISTHDDMTGLYNRLFFETELARLEKSRLYPISIIMAGVQDLQKVIDSFGPAAGDQLVINVARQMAKAFRNEDIVTRYGPDEFAVILPSTDETIVGVITNRIYKQVAAYNADHGKIPLNITLGYSTAIKGEPLKKHLKAADKMMREGRKASD